MPSDLSNYLATHYLIADPKPSKKRKRKQKDDSSGLIIADETESGWARPNRGDNNDDEDENASAVVAGTSAEFRRAKKSAWKTVGGSASSSTETQAQAQDAEAARAADAILASAAAETAAAAADEDASGNAPAVMMMSDGTHAGLQSASAVAAQLEARRRAEREEYEREEGGRHKKGSKGGGEVETIYRDATGRRVDVSMKRAELRREAAEAAAREAAKTEALRGEVQVEAARRRREELEDAKVMTVARHADDVDMNREMKEQVRWGDSMARFIEPKGAGDGGGGKTRKVKGKPIYQGAWTPNRYGIRPGYRWDGVDRGNGFEAERFKAINRRERNKGLEYSWQMDE
ncbi:Pre-mRNA-splicing factor of RES complex-domain-containing protein [Daldinia vernicosa]|uniref:Pre-mRNA-splicing factor of RES complex-domain-containing protein n=1 Tax=Daldinia vernicosa TaxID=114800 RepID=UPI002007CA2D|nr:Pre-mRNA-splicing factor of RES complex-domain-containing protein [Daldinia vernicosa]KAI0846759.1 Pre-mRNA-splicing factor of RES complex-domain-containing protein [Daldinia vernicosa]